MLNRIRPNPSRRLAASIELSPKQAREFEGLNEQIPSGVRVYLPDMGSDSDESVVAAARRLSDLRYIPVPHIAVRRHGARDLDRRIRALTGEAGVRDLLVIGGGCSEPAGEFVSTMDVLKTGLLDACGVTDIGIAGHPEGSPDFPEAIAVGALRSKAAFAQRTGARMRIVTQFGFDGHAFSRWARSLINENIDLPVHIGVAGPASLTTLMKYAAICGVGNSIGFLRRRALSLATLTTRYSPEHVVRPIEEDALTGVGSNIEQIHVFAFGGLESSADWLKDRASWSVGAPYHAHG